MKFGSAFRTAVPALVPLDLLPRRAIACRFVGTVPRLEVLDITPVSSYCFSLSLSQDRRVKHTRKLHVVRESEGIDVTTTLTSTTDVKQLASVCGVHYVDQLLLLLERPSYRPLLAYCRPRH